jgi:hypothetical protein
LSFFVAFLYGNGEDVNAVFPIVHIHRNDVDVVEAGSLPSKNVSMWTGTPPGAEIMGSTLTLSIVKPLTGLPSVSVTEMQMYLIGGYRGLPRCLRLMLIRLIGPSFFHQRIVKVKRFLLKSLPK